MLENLSSNVFELFETLISTGAGLFTQVLNAASELSSNIF